MKIPFRRTPSPDRRYDTPSVSESSTAVQAEAARAGRAPQGCLGLFPSRKQHTGTPTVSAPQSPSLGSAPRVGASSERRTRGLATRLGEDRTGLTPLALNRMPDAYALQAAGNAIAGSTYTYDGLLAHDVLNLVAAGLSIASRSALTARYCARLDAMLQADVRFLQEASARNAQQCRSGHPAAAQTGSAEHARDPLPEARDRETDAARVENLIVTRDSRGRWQYDPQKLMRVARENTHPHARHARDVLLLRHVCSQQGTHRRNDAVYQACLSGLSAGVSALLIGGTHGAALPVVAAGYALAGARELLWLRKPINEERQKMRDAKVRQMTEIVNAGLRQRKAREAAAAGQDAAAPPAADPREMPLEARAGTVAVAFANAEKEVADRRFGKGIPGRLIDHRKSTPYQDEVRRIVVDHVLDIIRDALAHEATRSADTLTGLQAIAHDPDLALSTRARRLCRHVKAAPGLQAIHALLTDMGTRRTEALQVLCGLADEQLAALSGSDAGNPLGSDAARIADLIHQPQLKAVPSQVAGDTLHRALRRRSEPM